MTAPQSTCAATRTIERDLATLREQLAEARRLFDQQCLVSASLDRDRESAERRAAEYAEDALEDVASWGAYASEYFQDKWDFKGCVEKWRDRVDATKGESHDRKD